MWVFCIRKIAELRFHCVKSARSHLSESVPPVGRNYPEVVHGTAKDLQGFPVVRDKVPTLKLQDTCATVHFDHSVSIFIANIYKIAQCKMSGLCISIAKMHYTVSEFKNINSEEPLYLQRIKWYRCFMTNSLLPEPPPPQKKNPNCYMHVQF